MNKQQVYDYLKEYYESERIAKDLCNYFDSDTLTGLVEFLKDEI